MYILLNTIDCKNHAQKISVKLAENVDLTKKMIMWRFHEKNPFGKENLKNFCEIDSTLHSGEIHIFLSRGFLCKIFKKFREITSVRECI